VQGADVGVVKRGTEGRDCMLRRDYSILRIHVGQHIGQTAGWRLVECPLGRALRKSSAVQARNLHEDPAPFTAQPASIAQNGAGSHWIHGGKIGSSGGRDHLVTGGNVGLTVTGPLGLRSIPARGCGADRLGQRIGDSHAGLGLILRGTGEDPGARYG
jgi:hypothetical protein